MDVRPDARLHQHQRRLPELTPLTVSLRARSISRRPTHSDRKSTRLTPVTNAHLVCRLLLEKKSLTTTGKRHCWRATTRASQTTRASTLRATSRPAGVRL